MWWRRDEPVVGSGLSICLLVRSVGRAVVQELVSSRLVSSRLVSSRLSSYPTILSLMDCCCCESTCDGRMDAEQESEAGDKEAWNTDPGSVVVMTDGLSVCLSGCLAGWLAGWLAIWIGTVWSRGRKRVLMTGLSMNAANAMEWCLCLGRKRERERGVSLWSGGGRFD
ncbi:hypothetical protein IWZ01DRAFT_54322 [Phyllosticta capitalensis]